MGCLSPIGLPAHPPPSGDFFMAKIMIVSFELTMPNVGSWNGKWTAADNKYYHIVSLNKEQKRKVTELINSLKTSFYYNFGDGWGANVKMELVDGREAGKRRKKSKGFSGYQWMCAEILEHGRILTLSERDELKRKNEDENLLAESE